MRVSSGIHALAGLCAVAAIALSAIAGCSRPHAQESGSGDIKAEAATVTVVTNVVSEGPFEAWGSYSADLRGSDDAVLTSPYQGGRVAAIKPIGTRFAAGDALCDIDSEKYEAALEAAKAQVQMTKGDMERARINVEKGSLGSSAVDGANLAYQNARMLLATAKRAYEDCRCQAPFSGMLVSSAIERYQTVAPGMPTVRLSRIDRLEAIIALPESEAFSYISGMKAEFTLLQQPGRVFTGAIASVEQAVDSRSRTVAARIEVTNKDGTLRPGMVGRVRILRKKYDKAVVVPSAALLRLEKGLAVMVAQGGVARQRPVTVGGTSGDSTLVTAGLAHGDTLIVTGAFQVSDGTKVRQ